MAVLCLILNLVTVVVRFFYTLEFHIDGFDINYHVHGRGSELYLQHDFC